MTPTDDLLLVSGVILFNNKRAFDKLVKKYQSPIRRFFMHLTLGNVELSNDLAQETFIKAYINLRSFKGAAGFSTWLYRIAYNVFYDFTRKTDRVTSSDDMAEIAENEMLHHISENIHRKIDIFESLKILRVEEKTAVLLFYMEDLPHEKIAAIMNCPLGTVKSYLLRSKEKLATYFKNSGYERSI